MNYDPIALFLGEWSYTLNIGSIALRIILSVLLSAVIGCERAAKRHSAGLRTFILVSLGCTVAIMLDSFIASEGHLYILSASAAISVAILSINSILFSSRNRIKGLTTAVGLWVSGIIGLSLGAGYYTVTVFAFVALLFSLSVFPRFEMFLQNRSNHFEIHLELSSATALQDFIATLRELGLRVDDIENNPAYSGSGLSVYTVSLSVVGKELKKYKTHTEIIEALSSIEYVTFIEESRF